jgi:hypothetical protein
VTGSVAATGLTSASEDAVGCRGHLGQRLGAAVPAGGQRDAHLATSPQDRALERIVGLGSLQESVELLRQHEQLIIEPHQDVVLLEPGRLGLGADGHCIDHQPRPALEGELLAEHRRGSGQADAQPLATDRRAGNLGNRLEMRPGR